MASRCTDSTFTGETACEAAGHIWCTDSPETPEALLRCMDISGVVDAVELVVVVAVGIAMLFTGTAIVKRVIRGMREQ